MANLKLKAKLVPLAVVAGCLTVFGMAAQAANYPSQPIRVIVPFAPGGSTDIVTRIVTEKMSQVLGQPIVVENKGGAGGAIGAQEAARAAPNGYTLSIATISTLAVNPACRPDNLPYKPLEDFLPVTNFANVPNVIEVNPQFPAKNFKDFVAALKANPGKYSYGSSGTCSVLHLFGEAFKQATGTEAQHVPYKGAGPAVADAVGGHIEIMFDNLPSSMGQIQAGRLLPMAIAWPERLKALPNVPTLAEEGYPQLNRPAWYGLLAPKGTSPEIIKTLRDAAVQALKDPSVVQALEKQGAAPSGNTPEEFGKEIKEQYDWAHEVVSKGNIKLE
ncbi:Tripartite-type tricarboxylate transporter receptor subunit TctC OS=Eoetvoesiella caeni OX=645616 GN=DFR37_10677 PE=3 SV=1 [Eoetvoesiella caeni]|uniref:Tripartite-type tricarboxylate transporter receptor subunit TctC n=2 Tax=Eoetvoesiella caeni TaxID=645616 RepID=A0A366HAN8_9BURK|nr:tripartite tricarboxylate transporter substrate binding protein BugE [Eoetvoesiella caeni]RBP38786.1 tripartite-type tricarboxylate transporter receptor subunit TctC [Eoetvoesiella caeni]